MPETYEILTADQSGTVSAKRRIGKTMNEQQVRLFIQQIVYA